MEPTVFKPLTVMLSKIEHVDGYFQLPACPFEYGAALLPLSEILEAELEYLNLVEIQLADISTKRRSVIL